MRFNLRLIGILHGILVIGLIGYYLLRTGDGSSRSSGSGKGGWWILLVGLTMFVVGYVGLFFGRVIKAAVSRQREYLADASAVQFTRNPQGVSGALKKIGGLAGHSYVEVPTAETASHMFFGSAFRHGRYSPFATHPPLVDRVRAVEPKFDGTFPEVRAIARPKPPAKPSLRKRLADRRAPTGATLPERGINETLPLEPAMVLSAVGAPTMDHMHYAAHWLASLPESLAAAVREPYGARCVVFALLLDGRAHMCGHQLQLLTDLEDKPTMLETERLAEQLATTGRSARLPLVDLAQGTLRQLSPGQYAQFRKTADRLIRADEKVSFFEFVIQCVLLSHLDRKFAEQKPPPVRYYSIRGATEEVVILLSALARVGQRDIRSAETAFQQAIVPLPLSGPGIVLQPAEQCTLSRIQSALQKLATCSMPVKKRVLGAATLCVAADGMVTVAEAELLRAVADSLDCPIPPILPGKVNRSEQRSS